MRLAIPQWQGRVSPVFDVAGSLLMIDHVEGVETVRQRIVLVEDFPLERARRLAGLGVDMLICGAISRPLQRALLHSGIGVISQICGDVEQVADAYISGRMRQQIFIMPGCRGWQRRFRGARGGGNRP